MGIEERQQLPILPVLRLCLGVALVFGCGVASRPSADYDDWVQHLPMGGSKEEVDRYFTLRDNQTGAWTSTLISTEVAEEGHKVVYRYRWSKTPGYLRLRAMRTYDVTFLNDKLTRLQIGDETTPPNLTIKVGDQPRTPKPADRDEFMREGETRRRDTEINQRLDEMKHQQDCDSGRSMLCLK